MTCGIDTAHEKQEAARLRAQNAALHQALRGTIDGLDIAAAWMSWLGEGLYRDALEAKATAARVAAAQAAGETE